MKVREMHNYIRLELNKINSNLYMDLLDEEIDAYLNKEAQVFLNRNYDSSSNPMKLGVEMSQRRKDDLRRCVVNSTDLWYVNGDDYIVPLPSDYLFYLSSATKSYFSNCKTITSSTSTLSPQFSLIPFEPSDNDYSTFDIQEVGVSNTSILDRDNFIYYTNPDDSEAFIKHLLESVTSGYQSKYEIYWEVADGQYFPNTIIVKRLSGSYNLRYTYDNSVYVSSAFSAHSISYKTGLTNGGRGTYPNIECQHDDIREMINSPFHRPIAEEPLITTEGQYLRLYGGDFIPENFYLTYIRKPAKISLSLQQDCELADHTHPTIIAMTVSAIKASMESQSYNTAINQENKTL